MLLVEMATNPALKLRQKIGSNADIAVRFGVTREAVRLWMNHGIPPTRALAVEQETDGYITSAEILKFAQAKRAA